VRFADLLLSMSPLVAAKNGSVRAL
jgi:hypothetical protein